MENIRIGILAYSTDTGLGYQMLDFAKHIKCQKILIADLEKLNHMPTHHERYNGLGEIRITDNFPSQSDMDWLTTDVDVLFMAETPLDWNLLKLARDRGVKTVLQYNYEFLNYFRDKTLPAPDVLASPSYWEMDKVRDLEIARVEYLPVPVDTERYKLKIRTKGDTFVHLIGRPATHDRNGTLEYLEALEYLEEFGDYRHIIYIQRPAESARIAEFAQVQKKIDVTKNKLGDRLEVVYDVADNRDMYARGDVMVIPRKYGGLCLPMWEALASGMPVVMTDISPNNKVLSTRWLCSTMYAGDLETHSLIPMYGANPFALCTTMVQVMDNVESNSMWAKALAYRHNWDSLIDNYISLFTNL